VADRIFRAANAGITRGCVACGEQAREAFERLDSLLIDGLCHGFFEISISCQLIGGKKRELTIKAFKSYRFTIPENEIPR
jgi:hypothetical protein